jgi:hypothetical protein
MSCYSRRRRRYRRNKRIGRVCAAIAQTTGIKASEWREILRPIGWERIVGLDSAEIDATVKASVEKYMAEQPVGSVS